MEKIHDEEDKSVTIIANKRRKKRIGGMPGEMRGGWTGHIWGVISLFKLAIIGHIWICLTINSVESEMLHGNSTGLLVEPSWLTECNKHGQPTPNTKPLRQSHPALWACCPGLTFPEAEMFQARTVIYSKCPQC